METFFVYSLVFLFLAGFALTSLLILATHPDQEERIPVSGHLSASVSAKEKFIAYTVVIALFLFLWFLTLQRREQYYHSRLDLKQ